MRPAHWQIFDEYFTHLLGGLRIKRLGFWLEGTPAADDCEFTLELEDGTVIFTQSDYDETWVEVHRPNGTKFAYRCDRITGKSKDGLLLDIDRYDSFAPDANEAQ